MVHGNGLWRKVFSPLNAAGSRLAGLVVSGDSG